VRIGLTIPFQGVPLPDLPAFVRRAEAAGFDSLWSEESVNFDGITPLAVAATCSDRLRLVSGVVNVFTRGPALLAQTAAALAELTNGRFVLGLGVSGPQVVEGWYGQSFSKPLARTREYVGIVREVLARTGPVTSDGEHYPLPYPGGTGLGKPLKSIVHPLRPDIPIIMGAEGPKNIALAAEIADGWFPIFFSPGAMKDFESSLAEGFARPGARRQPEEFEVLAFAPTVLNDDVEAAADSFRPHLALYIGGMGARDMNFHFDVFARMGHEEEARKIQALYLDGHKSEAAAAVPTSMVEDIALIGPREKIRDDLEAWRESIATSLLVSGDVATLRTMAELVG